ncbi:MAG TPA: c-type cytochrome [Anaerolineaceae bacterium]|nr:c-type cytochrome [Anaerolineaceae bacterium]
MIGNILGCLLILLVAVGLIFLVARVARARNSVFKWIGVVLSGLLALLVSAIAVLAIVGLAKVYIPPAAAPAPEVSVANATPEQIKRGEHLANAFCASCHSPTNDLPLVGGVDLGKDSPVPIGSFVSANLTPAGPLKDWTDGQIFRTIRNGIDRDGKKLFAMSIANGRHLSDEDTLALVAFIRSQPAVENRTQTPPDQPSLLGLIFGGAGLIPAGEPPGTAVITAPPKGPTAEYGAYILSYQDCRGCHGEQLRGADPNSLGPKGPSLLMVKGWTQEQFVTAMRTGVDPSGHTLASQMPWKNIGRMDDVELAAIHAYLTTAVK